MTTHLSPGDVVGLHQQVMAQFGMQAELTDYGKLEGAVLRPQQAAHDEDADLFLQAALLIAGIALAHAFRDGNKRVAVTAGLVFLRLNAVTIEADEIALADQVLGLLVRGNETLRAVTVRFARWLAEHAV